MVSKQMCIKDNLYNKPPFYFVEITVGVQLYFDPGSIKKKEKSYIDEKILGEDYLLDVFANLDVC